MDIQEICEKMIQLSREIQPLIDSSEIVFYVKPEAAAAFQSMIEAGTLDDPYGLIAAAVDPDEGNFVELNPDAT